MDKKAQLLTNKISLRLSLVRKKMTWR